MKVRIGIGASGAGRSPSELEEICRSMLEVGLDSIWIPELLSQPGLDPLVSLAWLAGRLERLKIGTTFLVPGRSLLRLAKQLATLDHLSGGRLLLVAVPGLARGPELTAMGLDAKQRSAALEEQLPRLRALLAGEAIDLDGPLGTTEAVVLDPLPQQQPLEMWLGGSLPSALDRCGRLGDGWLPAMITPPACAEGKRRIDEVAEEHGRRIDPEHFGVSIGYHAGPLPEQLRSALERRAGSADVDAVVPAGHDALREAIEAFVAVGFSKFVLRPLIEPESWSAELEALASAVGGLQT